MIVFCTTYSGIGGVARVQQHIRNYLGKSNLDFQEIVYNPEKLRFLNKVRFVTELKRSISKADMVIFSHPHLYRAMEHVSPKKCKKIVFTHGLEMYNAGPDSINQLLADADIIITNSKFNLNWLKEQSGLKNVHHLYYPGLTFELTTTPSENVVLCVGRMMKSEAYKGHHELIKAWKSVVEKVPDARLVFCGSGDLMMELKQKTERYNIGDFVQFTGHISDLELIKWYQKASVFAMPSKGEGQGLVWLEAMQTGLPVLAVADTVAEEFIDESENGILLPENYSDTELVNALIKALTDAQWRKNVAIRNKKKFSDMDVLNNFYRKLDCLIKKGD